MQLQEATTLVELGMVQFQLGDYHLAVEVLRTAVSIFTFEVLDSVGEARALGRLGEVLLAQGLADAAVSCNERVLDICREEVVDADAELEANVGLARAYFLLDKFPSSVFHLQWALHLLRDTVGPKWVDVKPPVAHKYATILANLGSALQRMGDHQRAAVFLKKSFACATGRGPDAAWKPPAAGQPLSSALCAEVLNMLGETLRKLDDSKASAACHKAAHR